MDYYCLNCGGVLEVDDSHGASIDFDEGANDTLYCHCPKCGSLYNVDISIKFAQETKSVNVRRG